MVRFHASTGLARLPYFLAVPCLCLQLQPILSRFILGNPVFPLTYRLLLPYIKNMTDCLNEPRTVNVTVRESIDEVELGTWRIEGRRGLGPQGSTITK
jgi:hypothetical protein